MEEKDNPNVSEHHARASASLDQGRHPTEGHLQTRDSHNSRRPSFVFRDMEPVKLAPPPQIRRPKKKHMRELRVGGAWDFIGTHHWKQRPNICVRTMYCPCGSMGLLENSADIETTRFVKPCDFKDVEAQYAATGLAAAERTWDGGPFIVVGIMGIAHPVPREVLMPIKKPGSLFKMIRSAERKDRPLFRRLLSLKHVSGFGIYECDGVRGYHHLVDLDSSSKLILADFFLDFISGEPDYGNRWLAWVQRELNQHATNPADGKYALQLLLGWDAKKIVIWGLIGLALSLVLGFWYQFRGGQYPGITVGDQVGVTGTAWGLASFTLAVVALLVGLLGAVTSTGDTS